MYLVAICALLLTHIVGSFAETEKFLSPSDFLEQSRVSLNPTSTWPLDHGDSARSKFALNAGFPEDVTNDRIKSVVNERLAGVQWLYTGGNNSEYLYLIGGDGGVGYFAAKLNATSLDILQQYDLQKSMYTGGMLVHRNGHVYCIHSNVLYVFWNGDLSNVTVHNLPTTQNGKMTLTNGMLVTQDGYLVIKQWSFNSMDLLLMYCKSSTLKRVLATCLILGLAIAFQLLIIPALRQSQPINNWIFWPFRLVYLVLLAGLLSGTAYLTFNLIVLQSRTGAYNPLRFLLDGVLSPNQGGGELKLVHPLTLAVVAEAQLPERCSFARMALTSIVTEGQDEDAIVLLGDESVHQFRWRINSQELFWVQKHLDKHI